MPESNSDREALLVKIKEAEKQAIKTEEEAKARALRIKANAQKEAASIIESSEGDGRKQMRTSIEAAKKELDIVRKQRLDEAARKGETIRDGVEERFPAVIDWMFRKYCQEHDVKN